MDRVQRGLRNWSWVFRYLALGCLFGSVYMLLLRPVKKQLLTILRELPLRAASKPTIAETATRPVTSAPQQEALEEILGAAGQDGDVSLKKLTILKNHLVEKVKTEPAGASRLVQNWLREEGAE